MTLTAVEDYRSIWEWVSNGLKTAIARTQERYLPEDVYVMLRSGTASLYVFSEQRGFVIVQRQMDPDGPVLFVFALWGKDLRPVVAECYQAIEDLAKTIKAKRIRMQSPRKGWEGETFFRATATIFEHEMEQP